MRRRNDEENTNIIKALAATSASPIVQRIILSYDIGKNGSRIRNLIQKYSKTQLKEAAEVLKLNTDRVYKNQLVSNIIHQIEGLLKEKCDVCDVYYNLTLEDEPSFRCEHCQQGCHNPCFQELATAMDKKKYHMFKYYCHKCLNSVEEQDTKPDPSNHEESLNSTRILNQDQERRNQEDREPRDLSRHEEVEEDPDEPRRICKFFIRGKCKYGNTGTRGGTCRFDHPEPCKPFTYHGATIRGCQNERCPLWHPPLCRRSVNYRKCFRQDCHFWHLKGTIRRPPAPDVGQQAAAFPHLAAAHNPHPAAANAHPAAPYQPPAAQSYAAAANQTNIVTAEIQSKMQIAEQRQSTFLEQMKEEMNQMKRSQETFQQQIQALIRVQPPQMNIHPQVNSQPQGNQMYPTAPYPPVYSFPPA